MEVRPFFSFHRLGELGRLGNQLFQYAALRALSLKHDCDVRIPYLSHQEWHGQKCLLKEAFNTQIKPLTWRESMMINHRYKEPHHMKYDDGFWSLNPFSNIEGFFQSILYFKGFEDIIKSELTPKKEYLDKAREILDKVRQENEGYEIVSLHLRRGDVLDNSNLSSFYYGKTKLTKNSVFYKYLQKGKKEFSGKRVKYLVFTGGSREKNNPNKSDITWCKKNLLGSEYIFAPKNNTMIDFCMIMLCDHHILSHISSFGWWAAYIGETQSPDKIIVAPKNYHLDTKGFTYREGFYPDNWFLV